MTSLKECVKFFCFFYAYLLGKEICDALPYKLKIAKLSTKVIICVKVNFNRIFLHAFYNIFKLSAKLSLVAE